MRNDYDFSNSKKNPYTKLLKKSVNLKLDEETLSYFQNLADETNISYRNLMFMFLQDCAHKGVKPKISWSGK